MKAFIELVRGGFGSQGKYELIEINTAQCAVSKDDVIFDEKGAYTVDWVAHFPSGSYPVVTKESLTDYRGMTNLVGMA